MFLKTDSSKFKFRLGFVDTEVALITTSNSKSFIASKLKLDAIRLELLLVCDALELNSLAILSAFSTVLLAMTMDLGCSFKRDGKMPRDAPPAPITKIDFSLMLCFLFTVKSFTSPTPSVQSPKILPLLLKSTFIAFVISALSEISSAKLRQSSLKGRVMLKPLPPSRKNE